MLTLFAVSMALVSCANHGRTREAVIADYGVHVLRNPGEAAVRKELSILLPRFTDDRDADGSNDLRRIPKELLFVEDAVKTPLRELAAGDSTNALVAKYLVWFVGDKADIAAMEPKISAKRKPLVPAGLVRKDLAEALGAIRETLKLPADHFRVEGLSFNRRMTKAYATIVVGPGAFNCEGWGVMFHLGDAGWELVWSKFEWIS